MGESCPLGLGSFHAAGTNRGVAGPTEEKNLWFMSCSSLEDALVVLGVGE